MSAKLSTQIIYLTFAPLALLTLICVTIQIIFYFKRLDIFATIGEAVYQQQKTQLIGVVAALSGQICFDFQFAVLQQIAVGRFNELPLFENVPVNKGYQFQDLNSILLEQNKDNQTLTELFYKDPIIMDSWYFKNSTNFAQLSSSQQTMLYNASYYGAIKHAINYASSKYHGIFQFQNQLKLNYIDGLAALTPPVSRMPNTTFYQEVDWLPADYCTAGTFSAFDFRCTPFMFYSYNITGFDGITNTFFLIYNLVNNNQISQFLTYQQVKPSSSGVSGAYDSYSQESSSLLAVGLQLLLSAQDLSIYDFILFQSTTQQLLYYTGINNQQLTTLQTLDSAWLDRMSTDQKALFQSQIPSNWSSFYYQQNVTEVPSSLGSLSNQLQDMQRVVIEYQIDGDVYTTILQLMQVYTKSLLNSTINNFYVLGINFSKQQIVQPITDVRQTIFYETLIISLIGFVILIVGLTASFVFSKRFANTIQEPIARLARLLAVIDTSYFQDIYEESQEQLQLSDDRLNKSNSSKIRIRGKTREHDKNDSIEHKLKNILEDLIANSEMRMLHESLTYVFQLIKYANQDYWGGNHDTALLKMVEAQCIYQSVGNITAQTSSTFNIGNIHFALSRWDEAISAYTESLVLVDIQLEQLRASAIAQDQESVDYSAHQAQQKGDLSIVSIRGPQTLRELATQQNKATTPQLQRSPFASSYVDKEREKEKDKDKEKENKTFTTQNSIKFQISSLQQKKFDRLVYILIANINKAQENDEICQSQIFHFESILNKLEEVNKIIPNSCSCRQFLLSYYRCLSAIYAENYNVAQNIVENELYFNESVHKRQDAPASSTITGK